MRRTGAATTIQQTTEGGRPMTTTPIHRSTSCRARTPLAFGGSAPACVVDVAHTPIPAAATGAAVPMTTGMNPWLGGDVQGSGSGSKYATKRIAPGRLEGMT